MLDNSISDSLASNHLGLFDDDGDVNVERTIKIMRTTRVELGKAFGFSPDQLRDDRIGEKTKSRLKELAYALECVAETFGGDEKKSIYWLNTPNPHLGFIAPKDLILRGKYRKVLDFIFTAIQSKQKSK